MVARPLTCRQDGAGQRSACEVHRARRHRRSSSRLGRYRCGTRRRGAMTRRAPAKLIGWTMATAPSRLEVTRVSPVAAADVERDASRGWPQLEERVAMKRPVAVVPGSARPGEPSSPLRSPTHHARPWTEIPELGLPGTRRLPSPSWTPNRWINFVTREIGAGGEWVGSVPCERCGTLPVELSALNEREFARVAQRIRAADFGLSRPMRCGTERERGERRAPSYLLSLSVRALTGQLGSLTHGRAPVRPRPASRRGSGTPPNPYP